MSIDWNTILSTLGSTAIIVAIIGFLAKSIVVHFLRRGIEKQSAKLGLRITQEERIRQELIRWANPIVGSVEALQHRLDNILNSDGYLALSLRYKETTNPSWSISYDYFLQSTVYLFAQYFCNIRLLEEELNFELFRKQENKDKFFSKVHESGQALSKYPHGLLKELPTVGDMQVFSLQQRALGEIMAIEHAKGWRCMRYSEFLSKWRDPDFRKNYDPLITFIESITPEHERRWQRLKIMYDALGELHTECDRLLSTRSN